LDNSLHQKKDCFVVSLLTVTGKKKSVVIENLNLLEWRKVSSSICRKKYDEI